MPFYSLEDQGFAAPFNALQKGANDFWGMRRQRQRDKVDDQESEIRRNYLSRQMDAIAASTKRADAESSFTPRSVTLEDGTTMVQTGIGRWEPRDPDYLKMILGDKVQPPAPGGPQVGGPSDGSSPNPTPDASAKPSLPSLPTGYRVGFAPNGKPVIREQDPVDVSAIEQVPVPGGDPMMAEVTRRGGPGGPIVRISPVNVNRADTNKPLGDEALNKFSAASFALAQLPDIEKAVNAAGDEGGPLAGRLRRWTGDWIAGQNPTDLEFSNLSARTLAPIAKGVLGETGVLSDQDIKRIEPLLPQYTDTQANRKIKLEKLKRVLTEQTKRWMAQMGAAGRKTENLQKVMAPIIDQALGNDGSAGKNVQSPVGATVTDSQGKRYEKIAEGPDTDRSLWQELP